MSLLALTLSCSVILSLIGALVLIASLYDAYKPRDDNDSGVAADGVTDGTAIKMTVMTTPEPPAYHINMAFTPANGDVNTNNNNVGDSQLEKRKLDQPEIIAVKNAPDSQYEDVIKTSPQPPAATKPAQIDFSSEPGLIVMQLVCDVADRMRRGFKHQTHGH